MSTELPVMNTKPDYWRVQEMALFSDLEWNIPERDQGKVIIIGGQAESFALPIKMAEYAGESFPFETVTTILPDSVKLPKLPGVEMVASTKSGSLKDGEKIREKVVANDFALIIGDIGKNNETSEMFSGLVAENESSLIVTRDAVDQIKVMPESSGLTLIASMAQLKRLFQEIYYPKMLTLTMPLLQLVEVLHKFTLSYPVNVLTFHTGQVVTASGGKVITTPIEKTSYTPLTLWQGQLAVKVMGFMLYNPGQALEAINAALFYKL